MHPGILSALAVTLSLPHLALSQQEAQSTSAEPTIVVEVTGAATDAGAEHVSLRADPAARFPGGCSTYAGQQRVEKSR